MFPGGAGRRRSGWPGSASGIARRPESEGSSTFASVGTQRRARPGPRLPPAARRERLRLAGRQIVRDDQAHQQRGVALQHVAEGAHGRDVDCCSAPSPATSGWTRNSRSTSRCGCCSEPPAGTRRRSGAVSSSRTDAGAERGRPGGRRLPDQPSAGQRPVDEIVRQRLHVADRAPAVLNHPTKAGSVSGITGPPHPEGSDCRSHRYRAANHRGAKRAAENPWSRHAVLSNAGGGPAPP